ncbi:IS3 family transposase [Clostridium septicum]|uniref:IS3 family transposase n=1 Tax=Clostridium septicum TaxID=1504 RepID=UPI004042C615
MNKACKALNVSRSGYYKFLKHKPYKRDIENEVLKGKIKQIFEENKGRYGSIRIEKVLNNKGININRKHVARLMRELKLCPKGTLYRYKYYNKKSNAIERPNLLNQMFQTDSKNKIWVRDITYIPTKKGTLYLAVFLDIYSRKVVGWSMESFYRTIKRELILDATYQTLEQAQKEIFKYIELYYNTKRIHSSLGYILPAEFEKLNS